MVIPHDPQGVPGPRVDGWFQSGEPYVQLAVNIWRYTDSQADREISDSITAQVSFLVDTGSAYTIIAPDVSSRLGIGDCGVRKAIDSLGGLWCRLAPAQLIVGSSYGLFCDVLLAEEKPRLWDFMPSILGRNVLKHFRLEMDLSAARVWLYPRTDRHLDRPWIRKRDPLRAFLNIKTT